MRLVRYAIANFSKLSSFVYVTYSDDEVDNEELLNCLLKSYNDALIEKEAVIKKNGKKSYDPQLYVPFSVTSYGRKHALDDEYRSMRPNELRHELLCLDKNEVYVGVCEKRVLAEHERSVAIIKNACERANVELPKEVESSESILKVDTERMLKEIKETVKKQKEEHAKHKSRLTKLYDEEYIRLVIIDSSILFPKFRSRQRTRPRKSHQSPASSRSNQPPSPIPLLTHFEK